MNWKKYLSEKDERKRGDMLQKDNRLSYDHVDDWLMSLKFYLDLQTWNAVRLRTKAETQKLEKKAKRIFEI